MFEMCIIYSSLGRIIHKVFTVRHKSSTLEGSAEAGVLHHPYLEQGLLAYVLVVKQVKC